MGVVALGLSLGVGCGPKVIRETVHDTARVRVELRRTIEGGKPLPRDYAHPVTISAVRIAHILAGLSHRDGSEERAPTIRTEHVYELAEGLAQALGKAGPDDEIAAAVFPVDKNLYVFTHERVTAFRAVAEEEWLVFEFYVIEGSLEKKSAGQDSEYRIPLEPPGWKPGFTLVAERAQLLKGSRTLRIDWRDPSFARPLNLRFRGGKGARRTILMEQEPEAETLLPQVSPAPTGLDDAQVRALDQLDAARRAGLVSESEFRRRRRLILEGRLKDAGYDPGPDGR